MRPLWLLALAAALLPSGLLHAQNFDYSFSHGTSAYQNLTGATTLAGGTTNWCNAQFKLPIGFNFQFEGVSFDTLTIESNGFVKFDPHRAVVLFHGAGCKVDTNNVYSQLSYSTTGAAGNKILKIQYTNCGYDKQNTSEQISYQLWLYEQDNKIEIHTGPTSYPGAVDSTGASPTPLIGLINPLNGGAVNALLVTGNANTPSSQPINQGNDLLYLEFVPPSGRIYTFTPNGN